MQTTTIGCILDADLLRRIAPRFISNRARAEDQERIIGALGPALAGSLAKDAIDAPLRAAHFLAQTCHESFGFSETEEAGDGTQYEGRADLGNTEPGDGPLFKGRGLIQLTGRSNYARFSAPPDLDLIAQPELAANPVVSLDLACRFWTSCALNDLADLDDCVAISFRVNGGFNGLSGRRACLAAAKAALGLSDAPRPALPVLRSGDGGPAVRCLQARLRYVEGSGAVDGSFGPRTEGAVRHFQDTRGLDPDGVVGPSTWAALERSAGC
jgi:putative chitinase